MRRLMLLATPFVRLLDESLRVWHERCASCELRLGTLLDAAANGIALCAMHYRRPSKLAR